MACLSDMAFEIPSLFLLNICLTAWHCLRAGYLFTAPARLAGTKRAVSCGSTPAAQAALEGEGSLLHSGVALDSGRGQILLMLCELLSPDKTPIVPHRTREESTILQTRSYVQESKTQ